MQEIYRIRIKGHLDPSWADNFDGLSLTHEKDGTTLLTGRIGDQPALHSLLRRVHNLGLPLLLVEKLDSVNGLS
jgi:hypothetical protein